MKKPSDTPKPCIWWLAYLFDNPLRKLFHDPQALFSSYLKEGMTAVDVGCGMGYFSIAMAGIVGPTGAVYAVDVQRQMIAVISGRAAKAGVGDILKPHLCRPGNIGLEVAADFVLNFWVLHEVGQPESMVRQIAAMLRPGGHYFLAEPKVHVDGETVARLSALPLDHGMELIERPKVALSRAFVYRKR